MAGDGVWPVRPVFVKVRRVALHPGPGAVAESTNPVKLRVNGVLGSVGMGSTLRDKKSSAAAGPRAAAAAAATTSSSLLVIDKRDMLGSSNCFSCIKQQHEVRGMTASGPAHRTAEVGAAVIACAAGVALPMQPATACQDCSCLRSHGACVLLMVAVLDLSSPMVTRLPAAHTVESGKPRAFHCCGQVVLVAPTLLACALTPAGWVHTAVRVQQVQAAGSSASTAK